MRALQFEDIAQQRMGVVHKRVAATAMHLARVVDAIGVAGVDSEQSGRVLRMLIDDMDSHRRAMEAYRGDHAPQQSMDEGDVELF